MREVSLARKPLRVGILGATGQIAKGIIARWCAREDRELLLYARSPERVRAFLKSLPESRAQVREMEQFRGDRCDVIVNCVGIGSPAKLKENPAQIFRLTAFYDDLVLACLAEHPETVYLNLSSGAVYGGRFSTPADESSEAHFAVNRLAAEDYYGIAKLHAEARHRALPEYSIVDVRIFGYFSRHIDPADGFLLSEIIACLKEQRTFTTGPEEMWRDYLHPHDLVALLDACIARAPLNAAYDAYSGREVSKFELLDFFASSYGLKYRIDESHRSASATGEKSRYFSAGRKAREIGYAPLLTSLQGIVTETAALLLEAAAQ